MSSISSSLGVDSALREPTSRFNELSSEEFIQIIFTELSNQDPFEPNDSSALLEQLNSIRSIESDIELTDKLESLVTENKLASASSMIGKLVEGRSEDFDSVTGFVVSVLRQGDDITLELDNGVRVPSDNVLTIVDPSIFSAPPAATASEPEDLV
ncbi:MAG: flagellar hook capping FlgD N-terminal domain-containing protein [Planctomycetota bacterium]